METIEDLNEPLRGGLLDNLSQFTGESPEATQRAFKGALPVAMYSVADYGSTETGAKTLIDGFRGGTLPEARVEQLPGMLAGPANTEALATRGSGLVDLLLGSRRPGLVSALAQSSHVSTGAMSKILSIATPLALGVVGNRVRGGQFDARSLSTFLGEQKSLLAKNMPAGFGPTATVRAPEVATGTLRAREARDIPQRSSLWPWVLAGAALALGVVALMGRGKDRVSPQVQGRTAPVTAPRVTPSARMPPPPEQRSLTNEMESWFSSGDVGSKRFELRGVSAGDAAAAGELAAVLATHPDAKVRIEAYGTDELLALESAQETKELLMTKGVAGERIDALGKTLSDPEAPHRVDAVITR